MAKVETEQKFWIVEDPSDKTPYFFSSTEEFDDYMSDEDNDCDGCKVMVVTWKPGFKIVRSKTELVKL